MKKFQPILTAAVLALTIQLFLPECKKYRPDDDLAKYQFANTTGICSGIAVSGQYYTGVALAANNAITVQVNVTKAGRYTIATSNTNGIQFSATGRFTSTGMQSVLLQGSGKPAAKGNFTYSTSGTSGCTFDLAVDEKPVDYAVYTVYETGLVCQQPAIHGRFIKGLTLSSENKIAFNIHVTAPGAYIFSTNNVNGIYFNASGNFTTTGDQTVSLPGFGTPTDAGNFNFNLYAGNGTCSFNVSCSN